MILRIGFVLVPVVALLFAACTIEPTSAPAESPTIPEEYRGLYEELDAALTCFEQNLDQK